MSIDPRLLKTMLQLQWMNSLDNNASTSPLSSTDSTGSPSLFDSILAQFMSTGGQATDISSLSDSLNGLPSIGDAIAPPLSGIGYDAASTPYSNTAPAELNSIIQAAATKYGVDPNLVRAVINTESSFRTDAVSSVGAKGLMQLMDSTAKSMGVTNPFDPIQNVDGGTRYLSYLINKYNGNEQVALAAYNAGPGRIDRLGISTDAELIANLSKLPVETQRYVSKVLAAR
ncbi:Lytic transglycosylase catalytic [Paenibacillus curdlanolyticus YK9]|uniref:Lytic transglycosylase catalytic n=1 Tax=Paenibacillus curdlanolyticus YK9 TaxID=717606 RepID=E0I3C4_9BACL|nr:lytic transglycosylase domain-containing protein [Paenibacillus curdlanolyticus]EFM12788.1 Lytic transglycosylase catalytic [Paenibacillus curdlanolyticus YK9]